jgi:hypothetical protein
MTKPAKTLGVPMKIKGGRRTDVRDFGRCSWLFWYSAGALHQGIHSKTGVDRDSRRAKTEEAKRLVVPLLQGNDVPTSKKSGSGGSTRRRAANHWSRGWWLRTNCTAKAVAVGLMCVRFRAYGAAK